MALRSHHSSTSTSKIISLTIGSMILLMAGTAAANRITLVATVNNHRTYALTNGVKSWQASCIQLRDGHHDKNNQPSAYCPLQLTDVHGVSDE